MFLCPQKIVIASQNHGQPCYNLHAMVPALIKGISLVLRRAQNCTTKTGWLYVHVQFWRQPTNSMIFSSIRHIQKLQLFQIQCKSIDNIFETVTYRTTTVKIRIKFPIFINLKNIIIEHELLSIKYFLILFQKYLKLKVLLEIYFICI